MGLCASTQQEQSQHQINRGSVAVAGGAAANKAVDEDDVKVQVNGENKEENQAAANTDTSTGDVAYSFWDKDKTYRPEKKINGPHASKLNNTVKATMKATLGGGDLIQTVKLPEGEDLHEWIAVNSKCN
jgi:hypothetical protein